MKILAIIGSPRKLGNTFLTTKKIEEKIRQLNNGVEFDYLFLQDAEIKMCSGCRLCFDKGEACCPHQDDIPVIVERMLQADGVIFASPTYVGNMTGLMKNFIDRLAYFCHRPAFYEKKALVVSTTGSAGAFCALMMMSFPVGTWGFHLTGKLGVTTSGNITPLPSKYFRKIDRTATSFFKAMKETHSSPNIFSLISFHINRRNHKNKDSYDAQYWRAKGWLDPGKKYFIKAKVNLFKRLAVFAITKLLKYT